MIKEQRKRIMNRKDKLYLVIPCYNEEEVLHETEHRLTVKLNQMIKDELISEESRMVFVDDGSKDRTWSIIKELHENNPHKRIIFMELFDNTPCPIF